MRALRKLSAAAARFAVAAAGIVGMGAEALAADPTDYVLWFMVGESAVIVDGGGAETLASEYVSPGGLSVNGARLRVSDGSSYGYCNLAYLDGGDLVYISLDDGDAELWRQVAIIDADSGSGGWTTGWSLASLGTTDYAGYMFAIELGFANEATDEWTTLAVSGEEGYDALQAYRTAVVDSTLASMATPWTPTTYGVPEPSGALLFLFGAALAALWRGKPFQTKEATK